MLAFVGDKHCLQLLVISTSYFSTKDLVTYYGTGTSQLQSYEKPAGR